MKVPYFELLNKYGFMVESVGRVHSPRLKDIGERGYNTYQYALTLLLMTPKDFFDGIGKALKGGEKPFDSLTEEQKAEINLFDLLIMEESTRAEVISALGFFIDGDIEYEPAHKCFLVNPAQDAEGNFTVDGIIAAKNWTLVCDVCLQCAYIDPPKEKQQHKYKDERTRKKFEEFYRKKAEYEKNKRKNGEKANPDFDLANVISAVAAHHNNLNMANIWDLTVYQVNDAFNRLRLKKQIDIMDLNYAVWGGKDHKTDEWFKHMT